MFLLPEFYFQDGWFYRHDNVRRGPFSSLETAAVHWARTFVTP